MFEFKNQAVKFLIKSLILMSTVLIFDQIIGTVLHHFYLKQIAGAAYRTTFSIDSTNADILVFGSSRASHHYIPEIFENELKMSFYNTGRDGNRLFYNYAVFYAILKRHTPKIVIFDIGFNDLCYNPEEYDHLSSLLPYYQDHPEIRNIIELRSPYERIKLLSSIYPFNSTLLSICIGNLELNKKRKGDRKGYIPLEKTQIDTILNKRFIPNEPLDSIKTKILIDIIEACKLNNTQLFLIFSPIYERINLTVSAEMTKNIASKYNTPLFDYSNDLEFIKNSDLFYDNTHLNDKGATVFSKKLVKRLIK